MKLILLTAVLLSAAMGAFADDYYVDAAHGSDASGDGSSQKPWRTITFALSWATSEDDVVRIRPGTYDTNHGESFPLQPASGVDLVSTSEAGRTYLVGDGSNPVVLIDNAVDFAESYVTGFTITGGTDGIALNSRVANYTVFLTNNTISSNLRAGVYTGTRVSSENGRLFFNEIANNRLGFYDSGRRGAAVWGFIGNSILYNQEDGVRIRSRVAGADFNVERNRICNNGGIGWSQRIEPDVVTTIQTTLTNTTISGNAGGGLYTFADYTCYYVPYFGYQCVDPIASIGAVNCTLSGNSGFGGVLRAGTSFGARGHLGGTIAWGNIPTDNLNFTAAHSDIGTGNTSGVGVFSADPKFVDEAGEDFRIRLDSPCVDALPTPGTNTFDIEGEPRNFDGNGDGVLQDDIGSDEFHTLVFPGTTPVAGQPFWFEAQAPPAEDGNLVTVLLSTGDSQGSGGIPLPGSGGRTVDLEPDALFALGLRILPFLQATLANQQARTPTCNLPATGFPVPIFYAAVTLDLAGGQYVSVTPTHSFPVR